MRMSMLLRVLIILIDYSDMVLVTIPLRVGGCRIMGRRLFSSEIPPSGGASSRNLKFVSCFNNSDALPLTEKSFNSGVTNSQTAASVVLFLNSNDTFNSNIQHDDEEEEQFVNANKSVGAQTILAMRGRTCLH